MNYHSDVRKIAHISLVASFTIIYLQFISLLIIENMFIWPGGYSCLLSFCWLVGPVGHMCPLSVFFTADAYKNICCFSFITDVEKRKQVVQNNFLPLENKIGP